MLCVSTGNSIILPAKRGPTTSHTKFHRSFPCTKRKKTGTDESLAVGKWVCGYRAGRERKLGIHSGIITCKTAHIQHLAPTERSMLQNMFPCTETGPPSSYYVHMSLLRFQSYFKKNLKTKKTYPHTHSVQCQACS